MNMQCLVFKFSSKSFQLGQVKVFIRFSDNTAYEDDTIFYSNASYKFYVLCIHELLCWDP